MTPTLIGLRRDPEVGSAMHFLPSVARCVRGWSRGSRRNTSGALPILDSQLRLAELVATLALAQDNAFGQPLESQLRSCLLATWICETGELDDRVRETAY